VEFGVHMVSREATGHTGGLALGVWRIHLVKERLRTPASGVVQWKFVLQSLRCTWSAGEATGHTSGLFWLCDWRTGCEKAVGCVR
jgi:hypothetical protein